MTEARPDFPTLYWTHAFQTQGYNTNNTSMNNSRGFLPEWKFLFGAVFQVQENSSIAQFQSEMLPLKWQQSFAFLQHVKTNHEMFTKVKFLQHTKVNNKD